MKIFSYTLPLLLVAVMATGCSDPEFTVKGTISDADGKTIILEKPDHAGIWIAVDSAHLKKSGAFSISRIAPADPEVYRLSLDGNYIYFPVDSIETITINAPAARFATDFSISGSDRAVTMAQFEKDLIAATPSLQNPDSAAAFKRRVYTQYLQNDRGSVMSYYILTKTVNDAPLFSLPDDSRYFAAVATAMREFHPDDPRLEMLTNTVTSARRANPARRSAPTTIEAPEIGYFDITLPDVANHPMALSSLVGKGSPVVLLFSDLSAPDTPALNTALRGISGIKVYDVGMDDDQLQWKNAAANLPWTCVYANDTETAQLAARYQLSSLPVIFLINTSGTISARCSTIEELRRHL